MHFVGCLLRREIEIIAETLDGDSVIPCLDDINPVALRAVFGTVLSNGSNISQCHIHTCKVFYRLVDEYFRMGFQFYGDSLVCHVPVIVCGLGYDEVF